MVGSSFTNPDYATPAPPPAASSPAHAKALPLSVRNPIHGTPDGAGRKHHALSPSPWLAKTHAHFLAKISLVPSGRPHHHPPRLSQTQTKIMHALALHLLPGAAPPAPAPAAEGGSGTEAMPRCVRLELSPLGRLRESAVRRARHLVPQGHQHLATEEVKGRKREEGKGKKRQGRARQGRKGGGGGGESSANGQETLKRG